MSRLPCGCPDEFPDWDGRDVNLGAWLVHEMPVPMFLHMPIAYELYLQKQQQDIERLGLHERWPGFVLTRSAMFRGSILCPLVEEQSPARRVHRLPNPFHVRAKLFHGDVGQIRPEVRRMQSELLDEGRMPKALYLAYLTCPACREARGGNLLLLLRRWVESSKLKRRLNPKP